MLRVNSTLPAPMIAIFAILPVCQCVAPGVDLGSIRAMATYILAFDHRNSLMTSFFDVRGEPEATVVQQAKEIKSVIADGLLLAISRGDVRAEEAGALVDATYGAEAIEALRGAGVRVAVPVEASGKREFTFEHADWRERLDAATPHWAKVLVRYNVEGDAAMNERQRDRLLDLQTVARALGIAFLFELLVPPEPEQRGENFDSEVRPGLVIGAFDELGAAGIAPDMWKIEGLERREDCAAVASRAGAPVVVLGRGADAAAVQRWLRAGAGVPNYDGFAIGRSIWWEPCDAYREGTIDRAAAAAGVADRYIGYVDVWRNALA
jgi:myo-inositol catabolism protein IolC